MAYPKYAFNGECLAVDAPSDPLLPIIPRLRSFQYSIERDAITGKNDYSWYPTIFSYEFNGFTWSLSARGFEAVHEWAAMKFINSASFRLYDGQNKGGIVDLVLKGLLIQDIEVSEAWGTLVEITLSGVCASVVQDGKPVEGTLPVSRGDNANNFQTEPDTANVWAPLGVLQ